MYDDVLVPTDGSPAAEDAVDLADRHDATLHVLFAVDTSSFAGAETGAEVVLDELTEQGRQAVREVAEAAEDAGLAVETAVVTGPPHREILDRVADEGVDAVVMGTHGRSGLDRYLLGSVAEKVVRGADVPVMTVPVDAD